MLNRIILMGRLTRDPELKFTKANVPVCTITLAVERDFKDSNDVKDVDFIDVVSWRYTAEFVAKHFRKGLLVAVEGRLQARHWRDKFEQNRVSLEVIADSVYFAERADGAGNSAPPHQSAAADFADGRLSTGQSADSPATPQRGSHGPRQDLKPVDPSRANVEYEGDLYQDELPRSAFEEFDDDGDVPF